MGPIELARSFDKVKVVRGEIEINELVNPCFNRARQLQMRMIEFAASLCWKGRDPLP